MCSVMAGLTALGGYFSYRQNRQMADAQAQAYNAQAQAAEQNARVEARKQEQIADNYAQEARRLRARQRLSEGAQRAQTGASGLDFSGSSMDILSSGLEAYNQDQVNLLNNQRNDNYASRVAQTNYLNQANAMRTAASNVKSQAKNSWFPTLLGTAASIYGIEQPWKKASSGSNAVGAITSAGTNMAINYYTGKSNTAGAGTNMAIDYYSGANQTGMTPQTSATVNYYSGNNGWAYNNTAFNNKKNKLFNQNLNVMGW